MEFGVCGGSEVAEAAAGAGFSFLEMRVADLLAPQKAEDAFAESLARSRAMPLPCPAVNCFIPGALKITGPEADLDALAEYVTVACRRARAAGVEVIVFGSGGARRIPDGFDRDKAHRQLVAFCRMAGPVAREHDATIAVESLGGKECNVLISVAETAALVEEVADPGIGLLVDAYHWGVDGDSLADVVTYAPLLRHVHVATFPERCAPGGAPCDLRPFFDALRQGGYDGRVSIEARLTGAPDELPTALEVLRDLTT